MRDLLVHGYSDVRLLYCTVQTSDEGLLLHSKQSLVQNYVEKPCFVSYLRRYCHGGSFGFIGRGVEISTYTQIRNVICGSHCIQILHLDYIARDCILLCQQIPHKAAGLSLSLSLLVYNSAQYRAECHTKVRTQITESKTNTLSVLVSSWDL